LAQSLLKVRAIQAAVCHLWRFVAWKYRMKSTFAGRSVAHQGDEQAQTPTEIAQIPTEIGG
jgi:hypothetical protein